MLIGMAFKNGYLKDLDFKIVLYFQIPIAISHFLPSKALNGKQFNEFHQIAGNNTCIERELFMFYFTVWAFGAKKIKNKQQNILMDRIFFYNCTNRTIFWTK
jgi:hypothetical protein